MFALPVPDRQQIKEQADVLSKHENTRQDLRSGMKIKSELLNARHNSPLLETAPKQSAEATL
jgi:hypothetical protein